MYLRFVVPGRHLDSGVRDGTFGAAYALRRGSDLSPYEREELEGLLGWFNDNLDLPFRFNRTKSKGYEDRAAKGISWFKASAEEHVTKMHRLAAILRDQGHHVSLIKTTNPGYLVYEDEHQVVAEPFKDVRA
jgi:hypothetical protein